MRLNRRSGAAEYGIRRRAGGANVYAWVGAQAHEQSKEVAVGHTVLAADDWSVIAIVRGVEWNVMQAVLVVEKARKAQRARRA